MKLLRQITALATAFTFLLPSSAFSLPITLSLAEVNPPAAVSLEIPKDFGSVETVSTGPGPVIVHIQSAHGNYEAQKKIAAILEYLKENYGFNQVLVEGSAFPLEPDALNYIPESEDLTQQVGDELARKALLKAPELFLMQDKDAEAYGIENLEPYRKNLAAFRQVLLEKETTGRFILEMEQQTERLTSPLLNKSLRSFLKRLRAHQQKEIPAPVWFEELKSQALKTAGVDLTDAGSQIEWPMLTRYFKIAEMEKSLQKQVLPVERESFFNALKGFPDLEAMRHLLSDTDGAQEALENLIEKAVNYLPSNFNYQAYPNLSRAIGMRLLQGEIKSALLLEEEKNLTRRIIDSLCVTEDERKAAVVYASLELLDKLFLLEMMPAEFDALMAHRDTVKPSQLVSAVTALSRKTNVRENPFTHLQEMDTLFQKAVEFYQGAKERDHILIENTKKWLKSSGADKAVVVTGGFHSQPFADEFRREGSSYFLITPHFSGPESRENYLEAIFQGGWKKVKGATVETPMIALGAERRTLQMGREGAAWIKRLEDNAIASMLKRPENQFVATMRAENRKQNQQSVAGRMIDISGAFNEDFPQKRRFHPAVFGPINRNYARQIALPAEALERIWHAIEDAESKREELSVSAPLRSVVFGSGQDVLPTQRLLMPRTPDDLNDLPSLIAFVHNSRIKIKLGLARDDAGNHVKDSILYINDRLRIKRWTQVPMSLTAVSLKTPEGQADAVAYILGNIFGLKGLRIEVVEDGIALSAGGGFENSNIYDMDIGLIGQILSIFSGRNVSAQELISILIRVASNEFDDMTGGQGILAAYLGANRFYFYGGILGPNGQPIAPSTIFAVPQDASLPAWLNANSVILQPGQMFTNGVPEERHDYTSRMMIDVTGINHPGARQKAERLLTLTNVIDTALRSKDIKTVQEAVNEYTDIRIWFQVEWLKLAREEGQPFYEVRRQDPFLNGLEPFQKSRTPTQADAPYLGGHYEILRIAREVYHLAVMPMGKGSFGSNWMLFGAAEEIERFRREAGFDELTDSFARIQTTGIGARQIRGWIPSGVAETKPGDSLIEISSGMKKAFDVAENLLEIPSREISPKVNPLKRKYPRKSSGSLPALNEGQKRSLNTAEALIQRKFKAVDPLNFIYVGKMLRRKNASMTARVFGRPHKLSIEQGGSFHLLAEGDDDFIVNRYGQPELSDLMGNKIYLEAAGKTRVRYMNALGGHGGRTGRKEMLSVLLGVPIEEVQLGTKGTDIGVILHFRTADGQEKEVFLSIFEIQIRRLIQMLDEKMLKNVDLRSLVNPESLNSVRQTLEKPFIDYRDPFASRFDTYGEVLTRKGIHWLEPHVQANLPGIDIQTGELLSSEATPLRAGGTAYWFFKIIDEILQLDPVEDPEVWMFVGGDNAAVPIPELVGYSVVENAPIIQLNTTTTPFDHDAGRTGWVETPTGETIPDVIEPREIAAMSSAPLVYSAGQFGGFGREGKQTQNTNMYYINRKVMRTIMDRLLTVLGPDGLEILYDYITPAFIPNLIEENSEPIDGAFSSSVHNLNRFFEYDYKHDSRLSRGKRDAIAQILPSLGIKRLLHFVNISEKMRTELYFPVKNTFSAYLLTTDRFRFDTERNHFTDPEPGLPLVAASTFSPDPKFYEDVLRFYSVFGRASLKHAVSLNIAGSFILTARPGIHSTTVLYSRDKGTFDPSFPVLMKKGEIPNEDVTFKGRVEMVDYRRGSVGLVDPPKRAELFGPLNLRSPEMRAQIKALNQAGLYFDSNDRLVLEDIRIESRIETDNLGQPSIKLTAEKLPSAQTRREHRELAPEFQKPVLLSEAVKKTALIFRAGILPFALHTNALVQEGTVGVARLVRSELGIAPAAKASVNKSAAVRSVGHPVLNLNLSKAAETSLPGHLLLESSLLRRMAQENPRALFLLLSNAAALRAGTEISNPVLAVAVLSDEKAAFFAELKTALQHQSAAFGAELETARKLTDAFNAGSEGGFFRLIELQKGSEAGEYVTEQRGGVAAWGNSGLFNNLENAGQFLMENVTRSEDWTYIAAAILLTEPAAKLIREEKNPEVRAMALKQFVAENLPGFAAENGRMVLSFIDQLKTWMDGKRLIEIYA